MMNEQLVNNFKDKVRSTPWMHWAHVNLFSSVANTILTLITLFLLIRFVPALVEWLFIDSVLFADSREACRAIDSGACWAFIRVRLEQFTWGFYPQGERWRLLISLVGLAMFLLPLLHDGLKNRKYWFIFSACYPFILVWLLWGGFLGLNKVTSDQFGGILLTTVIGVTGILISLPIGIALALGRRSNMPFIRWICIAFIEYIRGVPLITLLFVASTMLNYFLPPGTDFDLLARVLIMVVLFSSGYMAEVIRGGLQAIPQGQYEAADALGLSYWKKTGFIILPQALKISIPGIVNTFIGLFKDTTLVTIIGLLDILGVGRAALADSTWQGLSREVYVFVGIFFFICCFAMSRYSLYLERKLHTGHDKR